MKNLMRCLMYGLIVLVFGLFEGCARVEISSPSATATPIPVAHPNATATTVPIGKTKIGFSTFDAQSQLGATFVVDSDGASLKELSKNGNRLAWSPDGEQITLSSGFGSGRAILVMNSDGSNSRQITPQEVPGHQDEPVWSPDGKRIALSAGDEDQSRFAPFDSIFIVELEEQTLFQIPCQINDACTNPSWSSDGSQIVFASQQLNVSGEQTDIYVADTTNSSKPVLIQKNADTPIWQPHGNLIAFRAKRNGKQGIFLMRPNGEVQSSVLADDDATDMVWSLDGTRLAFSSARDTKGWGEIYIIHADGSNLVRLTNSPDFADSVPSWSPDGQQIAYQSNHDGLYQIYIIDVDGTKMRRLIDTPLNQVFPIWSPK